MISSIVFLDLKGQILIYRNFKDDINRDDVQNYSVQIVATKNYRDNPVILLNGISFIAVPYRDLIFLAITRSNINCVMAIQFLYHLIQICKAYCQGEIGEEDIRKKLSLFYEIIDQVIDYGCPQFTDPLLLKQYIQQNGLSQIILNDKKKLTQLTSLPTGDKWRQKGLIYKHNNIFIDVVEKVNAFFSVTGTVLRADVSGSIQIKSTLSGMPQCKIGTIYPYTALNDKICLNQTLEGGITVNDMRLHHCARVTKNSRDKCITFVPPDGSFELMSYRVSQNINLPFKILPIYNHNGNKIQIRVKLIAIFDKKLCSNNVIVIIPVPKNTASVSSNSLVGRADYQPHKAAILWKIKQFQGQFQCFLDSEVILTQRQTDSAFRKPPLRLQFEIPTFTASGLTVRYVKVLEKSCYQVSKYHKSITKAGDYQYRLQK